LPMSKRAAARLYRLVTAGLLLLLLSCGPGGAPAQAGPAAQSSVLAGSLIGRVVVVDAGHGGPDPGAVSSAGEREKDIALAIARCLVAQLRQGGATVILTRDDDHYLSDPTATLLTGKRQDLAHRLEIAQRSNADILVSIHLNAFPGSGEYGSQSFSQHGRPESKRLSTCIQAELNRILQNSGREALEGDFYLTRMAAMPSVIVEAGFLSNANEARLLADPAYRSKVGYAIASGIVRYFAGGTVEKPSGAQVGTGKIGVGQRVHNYSLAGPGVDEIAVVEINADMGW